MKRSYLRLKINPLKTNIDDFEFSDFSLDGYKPQASIKMVGIYIDIEQ